MTRRSSIYTDDARSLGVLFKLVSVSVVNYTAWIDD